MLLVFSAFNWWTFEYENVSFWTTTNVSEVQWLILQSLSNDSCFFSLRFLRLPLNHNVYCVFRGRKKSKRENKSEIVATWIKRAQWNQIWWIRLSTNQSSARTIDPALVIALISKHWFCHFCTTFFDGIFCSVWHKCIARFCLLLLSSFFLSSLILSDLVKIWRSNVTRNNFKTKLNW